MNNSKLASGVVAVREQFDSRHFVLPHIVIPRLLLPLFMLFAVALTLLAPAKVSADSVRPQASECPVDSAKSTPVWKNFEDFVSKEYAGGRHLMSMSDEARAVALGHALGRVAMAIHDDPVGRQAFACLERGIDQGYSVPGFADPDKTGLARRMFRLASEASFGMHDDLVKQLTGVTSTSPAYSVLGATGAPAPNPPSKPGWASPPSHSPYVRPVKPQSPAGASICPPNQAYSVTEANRQIYRAAQLFAGTSPDFCEGDKWYTCREAEQLANTANRTIAGRLNDSMNDALNIRGGCLKCRIDRSEFTRMLSVARQADRLHDYAWSKVGKAFNFPDGLERHLRSWVDAPLCEAPIAGHETRTNRPGGDYRNFVVGSATDCQQQCDHESRCHAWTYVKPGVQGVDARCWLKGTTPSPRASDCCTSGVKEGPGATPASPPGSAHPCVSSRVPTRYEASECETARKGFGGCQGPFPVKEGGYICKGGKTSPKYILKEGGAFVTYTCKADYEQCRPTSTLKIEKSKSQAPKPCTTYYFNNEDNWTTICKK